jgi:flagellar protein FlgJ
MSAAANTLAIDGRSLNALKGGAGKASPDAVRQAAKQFEALFMSMMLKSMRDALPSEDPFASEATKSFTGMLDTQLAQNMSGKGLGLADMMVKQLTRQQGAQAPATAAIPALSAGQMLRKLDTATTEAAGSAPAGKGAPQAFVRDMMPHAAEAARESGIPAHYMLGQAALESGWGKREIKAADGSPSYNLFGIKAGPGWKGATVETTTTEYVNGVARKQVERFRAYGSYAESFRDYARLVGSSPRYAAAAQASDDAGVFAKRIQAAGYATDPAYAMKLTKTINHALQLQRTA